MHSIQEVLRYFCFCFAIFLFLILFVLFHTFFSSFLLIVFKKSFWVQKKWDSIQYWIHCSKLYWCEFWNCRFFLIKKMRFVKYVSRERRIFVVYWKNKINFSNVITLWINARMISSFKSNVFLMLLMSLNFLKLFTSLINSIWSRCFSLLKCSMK